MSIVTQGFRITAATGLHKAIAPTSKTRWKSLRIRVSGCALAMVADGMGGKSGGRTAADQVVMTARQVFDRFTPATDDAATMLRQLVVEAHLMIKLTAITADESRTARWRPSGDAGPHRLHRARGRLAGLPFPRAELVRRTIDHSYVQRLIDEGKITEAQANTHPQSNLLTGCLGTQQDPPVALDHIEYLEAATRCWPARTACGIT